MRRLPIALFGVLLMVAATAHAAGFVALASGVQIEDEVVGTGPEPHRGQTVTVQYTGWLYQDGQKGAKFDSSLDRNTPFSFTLGAQQVIEGWEAGVATMHVGGKRLLLIPPSLGYGEQGAGGAIPPNATLLFEVELLSVQ